MLEDGIQQRFGSCERDCAGCTEVTRGIKERCALKQVASVNARKLMRNSSRHVRGNSCRRELSARAEVRGLRLRFRVGRSREENEVEVQGNRRDGEAEGREVGTQQVFCDRVRGLGACARCRCREA